MRSRLDGHLEPAAKQRDCIQRKPTEQLVRRIKSQQADTYYFVKNAVFSQGYLSRVQNHYHIELSDKKRQPIRCFSTYCFNTETKVPNDSLSIEVFLYCQRRHMNVWLRTCLGTCSTFILSFEKHHILRNCSRDHRHSSGRAGSPLARSFRRNSFRYLHELGSNP